MSEAFDYTSPPPRELLERYGVPEDVIDGVLCMHAHELAEKVRNSVSHLKGAGPTAMSVWAITTQGADLIDPEVE